MKTNSEKVHFSESSWQVISITIGLFALLVSTYVAYDIFKKSNTRKTFNIEERWAFDPLYFGEKFEGRVKLTIDNEPVNSPIVYFYTITNDGNSSVLPSDFINPIQISIESPWKIHAVTSSNAYPDDLLIEWTQVSTNTFELNPTLLNPGDRFDVLILVSNNTCDNCESTDCCSTPELTWNGRITFVDDIKVTYPKSEAEETGLGTFFLIVNHRGWELYWFAILSICLYTIGLAISIRNAYLSKLSVWQIILLICLMALSFASADIVIDALFKGIRQPWIAWTVIVFFGIVILYLVIPSIRSLVKRKLRELILDDVEQIDNKRNNVDKDLP